MKKKNLFLTLGTLIIISTAVFVPKEQLTLRAILAIIGVIFIIMFFLSKKQNPT